MHGLITIVIINMTHMCMKSYPVTLLAQAAKKILSSWTVAFIWSTVSGVTVPKNSKQTLP